LPKIKPKRSASKTQANIKNADDCSLPAAKKMLERKLSALEKKLSTNLKEKHILELEINEQFEKIKKMEASIERIGDLYGEMEPNSVSCKKKKLAPATRFNAS
jgi:hypothetical protein